MTIENIYLHMNTKAMCHYLKMLRFYIILILIPLSNVFSFVSTKKQTVSLLSPIFIIREISLTKAMFVL